MKKFYSILSLAVAATSMIFAGCSTDDESGSRVPMKKMTINASNEAYLIDSDATRTVIDAEAKTIAWSAEGETVKVLEFDAANAAVYQDNSSYELVGGKAKFGVAFPVRTGAYTYGAIYPAAACLSTADPATDVKINLPQNQNPALTSFDAAADIMITRPQSFTAQPTELNFEFGRVTAIGRMAIANLAITEGEYVKSVDFTAPNKMLTGRGKVSLRSGGIFPNQWGYTTQYKFDNVRANYADNTITSGAFDVWFNVVPTTFAANDTFTVKVTTSRGIYERTVTLPTDNALAFNMGKMSKFAVDMATAKFTEVIMPLVKVTFGTDIPETNYTPSLDSKMGIDGTSKSTISFEAIGKQQIRNTNPFNTADYEGASGPMHWWLRSDNTLTVKGIALTAGQYFTFTCGAKGPNGASSLKISVSKDEGLHFFPVSAEALSIETSGKLQTLNFKFAEAITGTIFIKIENTTSNGIVLDDVTLIQNKTAVGDEYTVDWLVPAALVTTPDDGGALTFAANSGSAGVAPAAQQIEYVWEGGNCTFSAAKDAADTWYTISDDNNGKITVTPTEYTSSDADRTGTITLKVLKGGEAVITHTITVKQMKVGTVAKTYYWKDDFSTLGVLTGDSSAAKTALSGSVTGFEDDYSSLTKVYPGTGDGVIKLGSSKATGSITTPVMKNIADGQSVNATLVINAEKYGSDTGNIVITINNGGSAATTSFAPTADFSDLTTALTGITNKTTITIGTDSKRAYINSIEIVSE